MTTTKGRRAATYLRISLDHTGEGLAVQRQREECARIIRDRGWDHVAEYVDQSITASDARKNRPQYDALVRDFQAGTYDALVCYDLDRLTRQPRQLEDWIDAAQDRGLAIVTANGEADLTTDGGRMFARVKAAVGRSEVERKSARQQSAARQRAAMGRPPLGPRLTGYTAKGEIIAEEAALVRRLFEMFHAGESLRGIVRELTNQGTTTRHGRPWNPSTVRDILKNPRYAGRAVYQGEPTGKPGSWEPIVSAELFDLVNARLTDPRRRTGGGRDRQHLGSGLYTCGTCGSPMRAWSGSRYRCREGCLIRSMRPVDEFVTAVLVERLGRPDVAELLAPTPADLEPALEEVNRLRLRLESIADDYDAGRIPGIRFETATAKVQAELMTAERTLSRLSSSDALGDVLLAPDPAAAFNDASLMRRRAVLSELMTVRLLPGTRYSRTFDPETVQIDWRGSGR